MIKLIKGELKKIFLKPTIFVVTAMLVFALALSIFLFNPAKRNDIQINISGATVSQMYDASFGSTQANNTLSKDYLINNYINSSENIINFYSNQIQDSAVNKKQELLNKIDSIKKGSYTAYRAKVNTTAADVDVNEKNTLRENFKNDLSEFNTLYTNYVNGTNGFYYVLLSSEEKTNFDVFLTTALTRPFNSTITHTATINEVEENGLDIFNTIIRYINKMEVFTPTEESLTEAQNYLNKSKNALDEIENDIETLKNTNPYENSLEVKNKFKNLVVKYYSASFNAYNLTQLVINDSALQNINDNTIQNSFQFANQTYKTKYSINEQKNIRIYYLETNKYSSEYANPLSLTKASNAEANAYDFMYFALEICSFIIILYVVFLGATMITGEYAQSTMKLLAIRPYSRRKILASKLISSIIVGIIFLIITFLVTFLIGGILYDLTSLPMLLIFNSTFVTSAHPIVLILILFMSKIIEISFFTIFALFISTISKSNAGSVIISVLIYFASFILAAFSSTIPILNLLPFVNTNLFIYFGSSSLGTAANPLLSIFNRTIGNNLNFWISFIIILIFSIIIYVVTSITFRKKDIK